MESYREINCENCKRYPAPVSYLVHESIMVRQERTIKRLWILCVLLVLLLVGTNFAWIVYENSFADEVTTVTQTVDSGDGGTATINDGAHINDGEGIPDNH